MLFFLFPKTASSSVFIVDEDSVLICNRAALRTARRSIRNKTSVHHHKLVPATRAFCF